MRDNSEKEAQQKKQYVKPVVTRVDLTPEEVVLGGCKTGKNNPGRTGQCRLCASTYGVS